MKKYKKLNLKHEKITEH